MWLPVASDGCAPHRASGMVICTDALPCPGGALVCTLFSLVSVAIDGATPSWSPCLVCTCIGVAEGICPTWQVHVALQNQVDIILELSVYPGTCSSRNLSSRICKTQNAALQSNPANR